MMTREMAYCLKDVKVDPTASHIATERTFALILDGAANGRPLTADAAVDKFVKFYMQAIEPIKAKEPH